MQLEIELEGAMLDEFPDFMDAVRASVYGCGRPFKAIAADLDMSVSELSRRLARNANDPIPFPLDRLPDLVRATGDKRPVHWLVESFIEDRESKRKRAIDELERLIPLVQRAVKAAQR